MATTGWKEWKKSDMTAHGADERPTPASPPTAGVIADPDGAFRWAVESTTDVVTFHARGGRMLFANRAARELLGIGPDDPLPRVEMHDFFDTTPELLAEMRQSIIEYGRWSGELDVRGVDLRIPASVVVTGHRDANGRYEYFAALSRDITEQRALDAARRRSEAALRAIVQSSPLPIFAVDARRHRPRVEPRVRRAVRMDGDRGDRIASAVRRLRRRDHVARPRPRSRARRCARARPATRGATVSRST